MGEADALTLREQHAGLLRLHERRPRVALGRAGLDEVRDARLRERRGREHDPLRRLRQLPHAGRRELLEAGRQGQRPAHARVRRRRVERPRDLQREERVAAGGVGHSREQRARQRRSEPPVDEVIQLGQRERPRHDALDAALRKRPARARAATPRRRPSGGSAAGRAVAAAGGPRTRALPRRPGRATARRRRRRAPGRAPRAPRESRRSRSRSSAGRRPRSARPAAAPPPAPAPARAAANRGGPRTRRRRDRRAWRRRAEPRSGSAAPAARAALPPRRAGSPPARRSSCRSPPLPRRRARPARPRAPRGTARPPRAPRRARQSGRPPCLPLDARILRRRARNSPSDAVVAVRERDCS